MNELVKVVNNEAVTDSVLLAEGSGNEHKAVIQLVRNYLSDFEEFGRVTFEMAPFETAGGLQTREVALLNEHQATLLLTYMRNSDRIREFKKKLVKAFFVMAQRLRNGSPAADNPSTSVPVAREFKALLTIARLSGLRGNQATLAASGATERITGQNPLALIGVTHLVAEVQTSRHLTATELGERMGMSAQAFNKMLEKYGLQRCVGTGVKKFWKPTEAGRKYAVLIDTGKRHSSGAMVQQLRWLESVVEFLRNADDF